MNKYQDAFNELKSFNDDVVHEKMDYDIYSSMKDVEHLLQELVDKATPMKPTSDKKCPVCGNKTAFWIGRNKELKLNRCNGVNCGQRIDWSEDE